MHLHLLEDARSELMPHEAHSSSVAGLAGHDVLFAPRARACGGGQQAFLASPRTNRRLRTVTPVANGFPSDLELLTELDELACRKF